MEKFLEKLSGILESEMEILPETYLSDIEEWDSLSVVSFAAMAQVDYGKTINISDIRAAKTVQDLYELVS